MERASLARPTEPRHTHFAYASIQTTARHMRSVRGNIRGVGLASEARSRLPLQQHWACAASLIFALFALFCGYSFFTPTATNGTSAFSHFAKLSFTDSGAISAIKLV